MVAEKNCYFANKSKDSKKHCCKFAMHTNRAQTYGKGSMKGHVYNAAISETHPSHHWFSSYIIIRVDLLRQKRDILLISVLMAHHTHMVSVADEEVLFFLKRGLRLLGGAC